MKRKIIFTILGVLLVCGGLAQADLTGITFTSNGTIDDPQVWDYVNVQNNGTVVNMFGGTVHSLATYDTSTVNQTGGTIGGLYTSGHSIYNLYDGTVNVDFVVYDFSTANVLGGNITTTLLKMSSDSVLNVKGGYVNFGTTPCFGTTYVHGTVNIYGYDFNYNSMTFDLTGKLADNSPFSFNLGNPAIYYQPNLVIVPEPVSLCLIALGGLFLRQNCKK